MDNEYNPLYHISQVVEEWKKYSAIGTVEECEQYKKDAVYYRQAYNNAVEQMAEAGEIAAKEDC